MVSAFASLNQPEPLQAMAINGVYLENQVSGYRTLEVTGREQLGLDLTNIELDTRDGARYKRRRIDSRTISVRFAITATTPEAFAAAYNTLKSELYKIENARLVFDDEPDKFFTGTYKSIKVDYPGRSASTGTIEIFCADPFKYSVTETTVTAQTVDGEKVLSVDYQGTYPAHPVITAQSESDNGFYGFVHSNGAMLQMGNPEEVDAEDVDVSEMLVNDSFEDGIPSGWTTNDGMTSTPSVDIQTGSFGSYSTTNKGVGVRASDYGSGTQWHGPGLNCVIPADSNGVYGSKNFKVAWMWELFTYLKTECVNMQVNILGEKDGSRYLLAGVELMDGTPNGFNASWRLWVNGAIQQQSTSASETTTRHDNPWAGQSCGECSIEKSGSKITFKVAGQTFSFSNDEWEDLEALEITLYAAGYSTRDTSDHAGFFYVHFRKDSVSITEDIPNSIMPGDTVVIDTTDGSIAVNGTPAPDMGAIGNQWEEFRLDPGENTIICSASEWVTDDSYEMKYREVYL